MPNLKTITYKGVTISVGDQSIRCYPSGSGVPLWFRRPVEDADILAVKRFIDAGRSGLLQELRELQKQKDRILAS